MFFLSESLKLQRNIDNYEILKHSKGSQVESIDDKSYFTLTKVDFTAVYYGSFTVLLGNLAVFFHVQVRIIDFPSVACAYSSLRLERSKCMFCAL